MKNEKWKINGKWKMVNGKSCAKHKPMHSVTRVFTNR